MLKDRRLRETPERATGDMNMPSRGNRSIRILLFLGVLAIISLPGGASVVHGKRIVVRNDSVSLPLDFEKGRFGTGKLYFNDPVDLAVDEDG